MNEWGSDRETKKNEGEAEIKKNRETDTTLRGEMIILGKKQSVFIDFLSWLNGGCLSGSHYLPFDLLECLHTSARTAALL